MSGGTSTMKDIPNEEHVTPFHWKLSLKLSYSKMIRTTA
jgi:hypothetical protein